MPACLILITEYADVCLLKRRQSHVNVILNNTQHHADCVSRKTNNVYTCKVPFTLLSKTLIVRNVTSKFVSRNSRNTKLPVGSTSSLVQVTCKWPNSKVCNTAGQYWWHFVRPRSTRGVTITTRVLCASTTICQKSTTVFGSGPEILYKKKLGNVRTA
jgi:hypothetical protein